MRGLPRFSLSTLLIVTALIAATLAQRPYRNRYVPYDSSLHRYQDIYRFPDGAPMIVEKSLNIPFFAPPTLLVLFFVWKLAQRRSNTAVETKTATVAGE